MAFILRCGNLGNVPWNADPTFDEHDSLVSNAGALHHDIGALTLVLFAQCDMDWQRVDTGTRREPMRIAVIFAP